MSFLCHACSCGLDELEADQRKIMRTVLIAIVLAERGRNGARKHGQRMDAFQRGRFSAFEATSSLELAISIDALFQAGWIVNKKTGRFPWTDVEVTALGLRACAGEQAVLAEGLKIREAVKAEVAP